MKTTHRTFSALRVPALLATGLLAAFAWISASYGAGSDGATAPAGFRTMAQTKADYGEARLALRADFPTDVKIPTLSDQLASLVDLAGGKAVFEEGFAESQLVSTWRCSWERSYLLAAKNESRVDLAVARAALETYYDLDLVKKWVDDPDHLWFRDVMEPAFRGDLTPLRDDVASSC